MPTGTRVVVVYGSETGGTENKIKGIVAKWRKRSSEMKFTLCGDPMSGTDAAAKFASLKEEADVLIVATSSFGDGDPPAGYEKFLSKLYAGSSAEEKPLAGVQHVVLGFGSTVYDTFQNCPRLTDRLLEQCGSRRFAKRFEIDECETTDGDEQLKKFETEIFDCLQKGPSADAPAVCAWTVPGDVVLEKDKLTSEEGNSMIAVGVAVVVVAAAFAYYRIM